MGSKGDKGQLGHTGYKGQKGEVGGKGHMGEGGEKGSTGLEGEIGGQGIAGPQGERGEKGDTGARGPVGEKGERGDTGLTGPEGDQGISGQPGEKGDIGLQGLVGEKGDSGLTGPRGEKGGIGDTGLTGPTGKKGNQGSTGQKGERGEEGEQGYPGFKGQEGAKGEVGEQGLEGERGETGDVGTRGPEGEKGERGDTGCDGSQGRERRSRHRWRTRAEREHPCFQFEWRAGQWGDGERQTTITSPTYSFRQNDDDEFILIATSGSTVEDLIVVTGSGRVDIENDTLIYGSTADTVVIANTGMIFSGIETFHIASGPVETFTTTDTMVMGPGAFFVNPPEALFSQFPGLTTIIQMIRDIQVVPPVQVSTVVRTQGSAEVSVLQVNDNDVFTLTGSQSMSISAQESVSYSDDTVTVRRGGMVISRTFGIGEFSAVTTQVGQGSTFNSYTNSAGGTFFSGPGELFIDESNGNAFFSNDAQALSTISSGIISDTFNFVNQTMTLQSSGGATIIGLSGRQSQFLPTASTAEFDSAQSTLTLRDSGGRTVAQSFGVSQFSLFDNNELQTFTSGQSIDLSGGGTLYTDGSGNALFSTSGALDAFISTSSPAPSVSGADFSFSTSSQGFGSLIGNGQNLITLTGAQTYDVPSFHSVVYQDTDLLVQDPMGVTVAMFSNVNQLAVNSASQPLENFTGSASSAFLGPGRLYINNGQAFYTTSAPLRNAITSFLQSIPAPSVGFELDVDPVDPTGLVTLTIGGQPVVELTGSTVSTSQPEEVILYNDDTITFLDSEVLPSGALAYNNSMLTFTSDDPQATDTVTSLGNFTELVFYDGVTILTYMGSIQPDATLPGNGRLFLNTMGPQTAALYTTTDAVTDPTLAGLYRNLFATRESITGVSEFASFDGMSFQTFMGSAPTLLPGGGTFYTNGNMSFYSTDGPTNGLIVTTVSETIPTTVEFDNGMIVVEYNGNEIYRFLPGEMNSIFTLGSGDNLGFTDGVLSSNLFPGTNITSLTFFDGIMSVTFPMDSDVSYTGPGTVVFNTGTGTAFFTTSTQAGNAIATANAQLQGTFRRPIIDMPLTSRVVSKFPTVDATFGQEVRAFEGADVSLLCDVITGNPKPVVEFFKVEGGVQVAINDSSDKYDIINNTLVINDIEASTDAADYTCVASNLAGTASRTTTLSIGKALSPAVVGSFLPFIPAVNQVIARAMDSDEPSSMTINLQKTTELFISCKGSGRPKPEITWAVDNIPIDFETQNDTYKVNVTRPGSSVLSVLPPLDTLCRTYSCGLDNAAVPIPVFGSVEVCGESFNCTRGNFGTCSSSCGTGFQLEVFNSCQKEFNGALESANFSDIPAGTLEPDPQIQICAPRDENGTVIGCPFVTFRFVVGTYTDCSKTCGCGVRTRNVTCQRFLDDVFDSVLNDSVCVGAGRRLPRSSRKCNNFLCPDWRAGLFGSCSETCGGGMRSRPVECVALQKSIRGDVLNDTACNSDIRPIDTIPCREHPCFQFEWRAGQWGDCSEFYCEVRDVYCLDTETDERVNDSFCSFRNNRPNRIRSCGGPECNFGIWVAGSYGSCNESCGKGYQFRDVLCQNRTGDLIDQEYCTLRIRTHKPSDLQVCYEAPCPGVECLTEPSYCGILASAGQCEFSIANPCCLSCPTIVPSPSPVPSVSPTATPVMG